LGWTRVLKVSRLETSRLETRTQSSHKKNQELINGEKREERKSATPKTALSAASLKDLKNPLAMLSEPWKSKYGTDLPADLTPQADAALQAYGDDLAPAWARYLADDGTQGRVKKWRHPIPLFTSQVAIWGTVKVAVRAQDAPEFAAKLQAKRAAEQANLEASYQAREAFAKDFNARKPEGRRRALLDVAAISDFMADMVDGLLKRGGQLQPESAICAELMSLEGIHG
jgi:hypothetical protein